MRAVLSVVVLCLAASSAFAALAAVDPAFAVTSVIPGWPSAPLAFTSDGTLWVINQSNGCLYKFPSVSGNPSPATTPIKASNNCLAGLGTSWDWGIVATASDRLFTAHGFEITAMKTGGSAVQVFGAGVLPSNVRGIAVDPTSGDLIIGGYPAGKVFRVQNPETHAAPAVTVLNTDTTNGGIDGIWVGPDGVIYAAGYDQARLIVVSPTGSILARPQVTDLPQAGFGPDGVAVAGNNTFLITSRSGANRITKWTIPGYAQSTIATTNGYTDYSTVGPDGCMYITSLSGPDGIIRVTNHDGTCSFQNPTTDSGTPCSPLPTGASATGDYALDVGSVNSKKICLKLCDA